MRHLAPLLLFIGLLHAQLQTNQFMYERLQPDNCAILLIDHQTGLAEGIVDQSLPEFMLNLEALVDIANLFQIPTIVTTSAQDGPNGPLLPYITDNLPNAVYIHRPGQIDAFDSDEFKSAVIDFNVTKLIIAGISTDVCLTFASLSALSEGFEVYAVVDASGTFSTLMRDLAIERMVQAGVIPMSTFMVGCELLRDWRNPQGKDFASLLAKELPFYANLIAYHKKFTEQGAMQPNETLPQPIENETMPIENTTAPLVDTTLPEMLNTTEQLLNNTAPPATGPLIDVPAIVNNTLPEGNIQGVEATAVANQTGGETSILPVNETSIPVPPPA